MGPIDYENLALYNNYPFVENVLGTLHKDLKFIKTKSESVLGVNVIRRSPSCFVFEMKAYIMGLSETYDVPSDDCV